jgi:hypothetical protein
MSSRRWASWARWSRPSPARAAKPPRDELTRCGGSYVQRDVDAWLAHALAAHLGHYADPSAREAAAGLLPPPVLAHAALLAALAQLVPGSAVDQPAFATRLAAADSEATADLATFLTRAVTAGSPA